MRATCLSRSVGVRTTPSASATSRPWAQVSMSRAGGHGGGGHGRAVPREADVPAAPRAAPCRGRPVPPASAPAARRAGERRPPPPLRRRTSRAQASAFSTSVVERLHVGHGEQGGAVGPGEVRDLVGDAPAGRGGREQPLFRAQLGDEVIEFVTLVTQVVEHGRRVCHGASMAAGQETSKHACIDSFPRLRHPCAHVKLRSVTGGGLCAQS